MVGGFCFGIFLRTGFGVCYSKGPLFSQAVIFGAWGFRVEGFQVIWLRVLRFRVSGPEVDVERFEGVGFSGFDFCLRLRCF